MTLSNICWYLCVLSAISAVLLSAVTVVPEHEAAMLIPIVGSALSASVFGLIAVVLRWLKPREPKWLVRLFQAVAVLATLVVLLLCGG